MFEKGDFVRLNSDLKSWQNRIACVLSVAPVSGWITIAILPRIEEGFRATIKVKANQITRLYENELTQK